MSEQRLVVTSPKLRRGETREGRAPEGQIGAFELGVLIQWTLGSKFSYINVVKVSGDLSPDENLPTKPTSAS